MKKTILSFPPITFSRFAGRRLLILTALLMLAGTLPGQARSFFSWRRGPKGQPHQVVKPEPTRPAEKPADKPQQAPTRPENQHPNARQLDYRWTPGNLHSHWQKHGAEFPEFKTEEEYGRFAVEFFRNPPPNVLRKFRGDGERLQYDEKLNIFSASTKDGVIKTMFRPDRGIRYWQRQ